MREEIYDLPSPSVPPTIDIPSPVPSPLPSRYHRLASPCFPSPIPPKGWQAPFRGAAPLGLLVSSVSVTEHTPLKSSRASMAKAFSHHDQLPAEDDRAAFIVQFQFIAVCSKLEVSRSAFRTDIPPRHGMGARQLRPRAHSRLCAPTLVRCPTGRDRHPLPAGGSPCSAGRPFGASNGGRGGKTVRPFLIGTGSFLTDSESL